MNTGYIVVVKHQSLNMPTPKRLTKSRPLFLAGNLALDFLNTRMSVGDEIRDFLQTDEDVLAWLDAAGLPALQSHHTKMALSLLPAAQTLRENIRSLVEKRKAGRRGDPSVLNRFLKSAPSHPQLVWERPCSLTIERIWQLDKSEAVLAPIAETAVVLLVTADFNLVRRCEDETCISWFLDRTKSHRRRWCRMQLCGNRYKVAAYRKRRRDQNVSSGELQPSAWPPSEKVLR